MRLSLARALAALLTAGLLSACGDRCESLCRRVAVDIQLCMDTDDAWQGVSWGDLDAKTRAAFATDCRRDWTRTSSSLATHELEEGLDLCGATHDMLDELDQPDCSELLTLYGPL